MIYNFPANLAYINGKKKNEKSKTAVSDTIAHCVAPVMVVVINTFATTANAMAISAPAIADTPTTTATAAMADTSADTTTVADAGADTITVACARLDPITVANVYAISEAIVDIIAAADTITITGAWGFCKSARSLYQDARGRRTGDRSQGQV